MIRLLKKTPLVFGFSRILHSVYLPSRPKQMEIVKRFTVVKRIIMSTAWELVFWILRVCTPPSLGSKRRWQIVLGFSLCQAGSCNKGLSILWSHNTRILVWRTTCHETYDDLSIVRNTSSYQELNCFLR